MKKKKGLSPTLIIVVILAFVGGFLLFQNQNKQTSPSSYTESVDETASWKTYTNEKYGFSFKHPNFVEQTNYVSPVTYPLDVVALLFRNKVSNDEDKITIEVYPNKDNKTVEDYAKDASENEYLVASQSAIMIASQDSIMHISKLHLEDKQINFTRYFVPFPKDKRILVITSRARTRSFAEFDQILSSFTFSDK